MLIYHPEAAAELVEAAKFYEHRVPGLGAQFLDTVDRTLKIILEAPERWKTVEDNVHRCLIPRFPYAIYYRVQFDHLRILAFKHHSRHPDYWRYRQVD